jgi:hypothetical protein
LTTRERVALQTAPASCQSCHGMINALGFALERFDAVGRYREEEGGKSIDASGSYRPSTGGTRTFTGARELAEFLAGSDEVHRAFVLQLFRYLVKQPLQAYRPEAAAELERVFASCGFNVRKLLAGAAATAAEAGSRESPLAPPAAGAYNHGPLEAVRLRRF